MFMCETPGSIAAEICGSGVCNKEKLLATLSQHRDPVMEGCGESKIVPSIGARVLRRNIPWPVSSNDLLHSKNPLNQYVLAGSKSAAVNLKTHSISKLVTNKAIASSVQYNRTFNRNEVSIIICCL